MTSEAGTTTAPGNAKLAAVSEAFDPFLLTGEEPADPGDRHAAWTLVATLRSRVLDLTAIAEEPLRVLILGRRLRWLEAQFYAWGAGRVFVADQIPGDLRSGGLDLVIADDRTDGATGVPAERLLALAPNVLVFSDRKVESRAALREAGAQVALARPPLDAERRFVTTELVLLVPGKPASAPQKAGAAA